MPERTSGNLKMSFRSLFSNNNPQGSKTFDTYSKKLIAETLIQELEFQVKELQMHAREVQKADNAMCGRPDYTWLMDTPKIYRIPPIVKAEFEEISKYLDVDDVSAIIKEFRDAIDLEFGVDKLANYLKFIMNHHIQEQRKNTHLESYRRLQLTPNYEAPVRSQSSAIIKQIKAMEPMRAQSAPLSGSWKKRSKVHPIHNRYIEDEKSDCVYIDLNGHAPSPSNNNNVDDELTTSSV